MRSFIDKFAFFFRCRPVGPRTSEEETFIELDQESLAKPKFVDPGTELTLIRFGPNRKTGSKIIKFLDPVGVDLEPDPTLKG